MVHDRLELVEPMQTETHAQRFERFAEQECRGVSPLYERLSLGIAADPELLALAAHAGAGQPAPNLLLAAVHFLLLKGARHALSAHYPSVRRPSARGAPAPLDELGEPYPAFRSFCDEHAATLQHLISTRLVQTNEVRRSACLLPAFGLVARRGGDRPLALVEIGASAGLNLLWDRYGYDYGQGRRYGDPHSPVQISCTPRGTSLRPFPQKFPLVVFRARLTLVRSTFVIPMPPCGCVPWSGPSTKRGLAYSSAQSISRGETHRACTLGTPSSANLRLRGLLRRQDLVIDRGHCRVGQANVDRSRPLARLVPRFPSTNLELNRDALGQLLEFGPL
jgi:hypothetical protein